MNYTYHNPILSGMYPDPSITRCGSDYYIVTSSFQYFPGVPVFHSRNLVNWEQLGHCLTRDTQLDLTEANPAFGIYAPTIRYHEGMFYMITTNMTDMIHDKPGNFIVTASDPAGEWSEPILIDHGGIDPDLLFDGDKVYFCGTGKDDDGFGIMVFEINPQTGEILSDKVMINRGCGGKCPEGPHLHKKDGWYYLLMAEGGTEYGHMITVQRSRDIYGPYEKCPWNPLITHRSFDADQIQCIGHGDMIEDHNGNWWVVCLGVRQCGAMLHNLGRETFLFPVVWEDGWPRAVSSHVKAVMEGPLPGEEYERADRFETDFQDKETALCWNYIQNPVRERYQYTSDGIRLTGASYGLSEDKHSPTFMGVRQKELETVTETELQMELAQDGVAGLAVYYMATHHYEIQLHNQSGRYEVKLVKRLYDMETVSEPVEVTGASVKLGVKSDGYQYIFYCETEAEGRRELGSGLTVGMATEAMEFMTFTGTYLGIFAQGTEAVFTHFSNQWGGITQS